jgi:predicted  nucleic acid-binding Zn-ribbon protein
MEAPETRTALVNKDVSNMNAAYTPKKETITLSQQVYALEVELQEVVQAYAESLQEVSVYLERIDDLEEQLDALSRANERLRNLFKCPWLLRIFRLT